MSDITNNRTDSVSIQERVRIAEAAKAKLDAEIAENNRLLEELNGDFTFFLGLVFKQVEPDRRITLRGVDHNHVVAPMCRDLG